jgi:DNA polymerase III sliding clamp (beta) subunit (PCNA family)
MNITILKTDLALALRAANQVMANKPPLPILANVRCNVFDGHFHLDAVGMQGYSSQARFPAQHDAGSEASFLVNAKVLANNLQRFPEKVEMRLLRNKLQIASVTGGRIALMLADYDAFPPLPSPDDAGDWIRFDLDDLADTARGLLRGTDEMAHTDRPWQNVAHFICAGEEFLAISSDGKRTATVDGKCSGPAGIAMDVPVRALRALESVRGGVRTVTEGPIPVELGEDPHRTWMRVGNVLRLCFSRQHVQFPDIAGQILSKLRFDDRVRVVARALQTAIETAAAIGHQREASDRFAHGFRLEANPHSIVVATEVKDRGECEEEVVHSSVLPSFTTGYDYDLVLPVLRECEGEAEIAFAEQGLNRPMRITDETDRLRCSWIVQSLNIYPGSGLPSGERPAPSNEGRDTSVLTPLDRRILDALREHGPMTPDECATAIGEEQAAGFNTRPRFTELKKGGWIRDTGAKRPNATGGQAAVMEVI